MRMLPAVAGSLVLALSVAACGSGGGGGGDDAGGSAKDYATTDPTQIKKDAIAAMESLDSVHLSGRIEQNGAMTDLDVSVDGSGDCTGTLNMAGRGSMQILRADHVSYFKGDEEFWQTQATGSTSVDQIMAVIGDRWVTDSSDPDGFESLCDLHELISGDDDSDDTTPTLLGTDTVDGQAVVKIRGKGDDGKPTTASIAAEDPHYILRLDRDSGQYLAFSDFGDPVTVDAPAPDDVFDTAH